MVCAASLAHHILHCLLDKHSPPYCTIDATSLCFALQVYDAGLTLIDGTAFTGKSYLQRFGLAAIVSETSPASCAPAALDLAVSDPLPCNVDRHHRCDTCDILRYQTLQDIEFEDI